MYQKEVEVRWNDLDANWHMANAAYVQMGSTTRMAFFDSLGFSLEKMQQKRIGPIVFQEGFLGDRIRITVQLSGLSEAGRFFATQQEFYDKEGNNLARILLTGGFFNTETRKITTLDAADYKKLSQAPKTAAFQVLTSKDTRSLGEQPIPWNSA
ncbi:MAG: acyl-CoA thioesterase [Flavobacteriaceae bacterium]